MAERISRISVAVTSLSLLLLVAAFVLLCLRQSLHPAALVVLLPAVWLWVASLLSLGETGHAAYGVVMAALIGLGLNAWLAAEVFGRETGRPLLPRMPLGWEDAIKVQFPIAVIVLVPSAVGWWQRRRDRTAADADRGEG